MNKIEWSENFSVRVSEIDKQHQQLITILNDLIEARNHEKNIDEISATISKMVEYIDYHFGTEEKYMLRFHYAGLQPHRNEHRSFIQKVLDFRKQLSLGNPTILTDMLSFLMDWLRVHICETDKKYSQCFRENGLV